MTEPPTAPWRPRDTFADRLVLLRRKLELNQRAIADLCGLSSATWATWELGASPRNMAEVVAKISAATGCDREWLMFGDEPQPVEVAS